MKAQFVILFLLAILLSTKGFAVNNKAQQEDKKTQKSKYDFNIIKLYAITVQHQSPDSLKTTFRIVAPKRKED